jgi:glycosyltransferase involved in cell wall biosynthesis
MKIVLLTNNLWAGGKERRLLELMKGLAHYPDIDLHLVCFSDRIHYKEVYDLGIPITILKRVPKKSPKVFYQLFKLCKEWKPDLIHSWSSMSTIIAIPTAKLLNIKLINGNIADAPPNMNIFDQRLFRARLTFPFSEVILSNSQAGLKAYKTPKSKGICIYNGFDPKRVLNLESKASIRDRFNITTEMVVVMVGSFTKSKDYKTYISAALIILKERNDVTFLAVGAGSELETHQTMIPLEAASRFIFTGLQKNVESIINACDIGVLSTNIKAHGEGISNAILEYMAVSKPTIASIGGGTAEVLVDMKTGFLVPPALPKIMADKLNQLLDDPSLMRVMGKAGRERLESVFGLEKMTKTFYELYQDLMK